MSTPFYVSPQQAMADRAEYARKGIARGRSVVVLQYTDGIVFVAENPSRALHKVSEIYDRIAFAAVGKYNEFENLRIGGVRYADLRGYTYDRDDVTARGLANVYAQTLGTIFSSAGEKPYEVELIVAEVGCGPGGRPDLPAAARRLHRRRARRGRGRRQLRPDRHLPRPAAPRRHDARRGAQAGGGVAQPGHQRRRTPAHRRAAGGRGPGPHPPAAAQVQADPRRASSPDCSTPATDAAAEDPATTSRPADSGGRRRVRRDTRTNHGGRTGAPRRVRPGAFSPAGQRPVEPRTTSSTGSETVPAGAPWSPDSAASSARMPCAPTSSAGSRTVVSSGSTAPASARSSKPVTRDVLRDPQPQAAHGLAGAGGQDVVVADQRGGARARTGEGGPPRRAARPRRSAPRSRGPQRAAGQRAQRGVEGPRAAPGRSRSPPPPRDG